MELKMSRLHKITSLLAVVTLLLSSSVQSAEGLSQYEALFNRVEKLEQSGKVDRDWLLDACTYEAGSAGLTAYGLTNCLGRLVSKFEKISSFASNIAQIHCAPQALFSQGISSDECLGNNLRTADFKPEEFINHEEHEDCSGHKNGVDLIAQVQRELTVKTAIGCEPGEVPCVDDRVKLETNGRHSQYQGAGAISCRDNYTNLVQHGSMVLVTTDVIESSDTNLTAALVSAHVFKDSRGGLNMSCKAFVNNSEEKLVQVRITNKAINTSSFNKRDPNDEDHDFGLLALETISGHKVSDFVTPFEIAPYDGNNLERDINKGNRVSLAGYGASNVNLEIDESCQAKQGAPGYVFSNPRLIMHTCDTNGGSSGAGIFLGKRLIAIHTGRTPSPAGETEEESDFRKWDFTTNANRGIFITQEMVEAAENLVSSPFRRTSQK